MNTLTQILIPGGLSYLAALALGPVVIPALQRLKAAQTEREEGLESHKKKTGTPTMGGFIFLIPALILPLFYLKGNPEILAILILTFGYGLVGFLDDYLKVVRHQNLGLRAWQKLLLQFLFTGVFVWFLTTQTDISLAMRIPFLGGRTLDLGWFNVPFLFIAALGTANGTNFTDGVDGLCAQVTIAVAAFFGLCAMKLGSGSAVVSFCMMGALLGYLFFNVYPGKVMMGDTGSLAIGGFVTAAAYVLQMPLFILIAGIIYVVEVLSVILQVGYFKATHGKRIFRMAPIHHHYEKGGWSETRVVAAFTTVTIWGCILAYVALG